MYRTLKEYIPRQSVDLNKLVYEWGYGTQELFMKLREKKFMNTKQIHMLCLNEILNENKIKINQDLAKKMVEDVWDDFVKNNKIYPDTIPSLSHFRKSNYTLGIITDCDLDVVEGIINKHQLNGIFDIKIISSEIRAYKPDPKIFIKAAELAKCTPEESIYVGDSEMDIKGAKEAGFSTMILDRGELESPKLGIEPDYKINNLFEMQEILKDLEKTNNFLK
jgi:HAD superfamily hydrolase (TIGR01549 family)